ncbi:MAG: potassium transporter [Muribaculaceae bacterium]
MKSKWLRQIGSPLLRRRKAWQYIGLRFRRRMDRMDNVATSVISTLTAIASLLCLICLAVYIGFEHADVSHELLHRLLRWTQGIFISGIIFNLTFRFRRAMKENRAVKWVADSAILLTLVPLIYPQPSHPWIPVLEKIMYSRYFLYSVLCVYSMVDLSAALMKLPGRRTNPSLILASSFLFFILSGTLVLMLPRCTTNGISFVDSLFVATSAVSITGLTTVDVPATFTPLGLSVLAILVQTGGLGVLTFTSFFSVFFSGRPTIYHQLLIRDFIYSRSMSALIPVLLYILAFTLAVEAAGAVALYFTLPEDLFASNGERAAAAAFHSLSAFCNAGFSTIPEGMANRTLMNGDQNIYMVMSVLIFAGGIGFPNLVNIKDAVARQLSRLGKRLSGNPSAGERNAHLFDLNTKLVLATTIIIFIAGAISFFIIERNNSLEGMPLRTRIIQSIFNAATPRSAGFTSLDPAFFLNATIIIVLIQMAIGGASQSMAGGIKVNTFATVLLSLRATVAGRGGVSAFRRNIAPTSVRRAHAVVIVSLLALALCFIAVVISEPHLPLRALFFECVSALFTVGSSLGITAELSPVSKIILSAAMFTGRVGILSLLCGLASGKRADKTLHYPADDIVIS